MADAVRLRNDIVHHRGIATKRNAGCAEVLTWFDEGDAILVTTARVAEFMGHFGLTVSPMHE
jgi:hypothetical protein